MPETPIKSLTFKRHYAFSNAVHKRVAGRSVLKVGQA